MWMALVLVIAGVAGGVLGAVMGYYGLIISIPLAAALGHLGAKKQMKESD